jgi:hypothetical protein
LLLIYDKLVWNLEFMLTAVWRESGMYCGEIVSSSVFSKLSFSGVSWYPWISCVSWYPWISCVSWYSWRSEPFLSFNPRYRIIDHNLSSLRINQMWLIWFTHLLIIKGKYPYATVITRTLWNRKATF